MPGHDIVVVGFSAGGVDPLLQLVARLPADVPAALFVVHHFPPQCNSALPSILRRTSALPTAQAVDGEPIVPGRIYVACPDRHLVLADGRTRLSYDPQEHGHRPAIDPLFRSAARSFGPRVIGVILSGTLDDGTAGLLEIKACGGLALVQQPDEAAYPGMPASALQHVRVDHVAPGRELGEVLDRLVREPAPEGYSAAPVSAPATTATDAPPAARDLLPESSPLEDALWSAVRALEEKADLSRRLAERSGDRGLHRAAERFASAARDAEAESTRIRARLLERPVRQAPEAGAERW